MRKLEPSSIANEFGNGLAGVLVGALIGLVPTSLASAGVVTLGLAYALLVFCWFIIGALLTLVPSMRALHWRWKVAILMVSTLCLFGLGLYEARSGPRPSNSATSLASPTIYVDCAQSPFPSHMPASGVMEIVMLAGEPEENMPAGFAEHIAVAGTSTGASKGETALTCTVSSDANAPLSSITLIGEIKYQSRQPGAPLNAFLPRLYPFFIRYLPAGTDKPFTFYVRNYTTVFAQFKLKSYGFARIGNDPTIRRVGVVEPVGLTNTSLFPAPPSVAIKFGKS